MAPDAYDIKQDIGIIMQNVAVFDELTVYENIDYFCGLYIKDKAKRKELVEEAIAFVELNDFRKFYPKKLSGGLLRRLNIACGIAHKPRLIILDEPTVGVDPAKQEQNPGRDPDPQQAGRDHHLHLALHGGGRADLHPDRHHGKWQDDRPRHERRAQSRHRPGREDHTRYPESHSA